MTTEEALKRIYQVLTDIRDVLLELRDAGLEADAVQDEEPEDGQAP